MVSEQTRHWQKAHAEKRKEDGEASLFLLATLSTHLPVELHVQPKALHWLKINKQTNKVKGSCPPHPVYLLGELMFKHRSHAYKVLEPIPQTAAGDRSNRNICLYQNNGFFGTTTIDTNITGILTPTGTSYSQCQQNYFLTLKRSHMNASRDFPVYKFRTWLSTTCTVEQKDNRNNYDILEKKEGKTTCCLWYAWREEELQEFFSLKW